MSKVYFRGNRAQAKRVARQLKDVLLGRASDPFGIARGVFMAIGLAALSDIKDDFVRKANGETGEDGNAWPDLSPRTKAYGRRIGQAEGAQLRSAAGLTNANSRGPNGARGLMTAQQLRQWNGIFAGMLQRLRLSMDEGAARARAAQIAWSMMKRRGVRTMISVYGSRKVQVLRDTGVLLNSLSPGELNGDHYTRPTENGGDDQIFSPLANGIIVGTNVAYAGTHQNGNPARGIPARPFLPLRDPPAVWLTRWEKVAQQAVAIAARLAYQGAA